MNRFIHPILPARTLARLARVMERWIEECGAIEVPLPWMADERFVEATRPPNVPDQPRVPYGHLVASGEQTFLQLAEEGRLQSPGRYIGWTPCFRQEKFDAQHHFYFLKAEVFAWLDEMQEEQHQLMIILDLARQILQDETSEVVRPVPLKDGTWDLEINGVEVGSYGIRSLPMSGRRYIYGTALAEPRFAFALNQEQQT